jgi:hypothetical protein
MATTKQSQSPGLLVGMFIAAACGMANADLRSQGDGGMPDDARTMQNAAVDVSMDAAEVRVRDASFGDADAAETSVNRVSERFDYWGFVHTGQSLSVGSAGGTPNAAPQPFGNLQLFDSTGQYTDTGSFSLALLRSPIRPLPYTANYPQNIGGETPAEGMANQLSALTLAREGAPLVAVPSVVGQGGRQLSIINKQAGAQYPAVNPSMVSSAYWASLFEVTQIRTLAMAQGKRYGIGAIVMTHGENDALSLELTEQRYADGLFTLLTDYRADLMAITGQSANFPMFLTQQHIVKGDVHTASGMTLGQALAAEQHPGEIVLVGPKYQFEYASDRVHLPAAAYERLGEKYAEIVDQHVLQGRPFRPLEPKAVARAGNVLRVSFNVPSPPLAFESAFPVLQEASYPWRLGKGFEVREADGTKVVITNVALSIASPGTVEITLDRVPGPNAQIAYALTSASSPGAPTAYAGGFIGGRHGNLHDSDPFVPRDRIQVGVNVAGAVLTSAGAFVRTTTHDRVTFAGETGEWTVVAHTVDTVTLDRPAPMRATLAATLMSDQRNYAVSFARVVP